MKSLSIEARTAETAQGLRSALADFEPEVIEQDPEAFVVRVDLSPYGGSDIGSVLSAIQRYIASCQARSALIELDGRTYMIEARQLGVETPIALRYPNGRVHDTTLDRDLLPGERFEMYGRTWTAVRTKQERGKRVSRAVHRMVCVTAESAPPTNSATDRAGRPLEVPPTRPLKPL